MIQLTRRTFLATSIVLPLAALAGCKERGDTRTTEEKQEAPAPDFKTRLYMACPKCGAPQRPYSVNATKSFYRCSGAPPKFPYHTEYKYEHTLELRPERRVEI